MARRRDPRRLGRGLPARLPARRSRLGHGFPFDLPVVAAIEELSLDAPVTLPPADNGRGKSTVVRRSAPERFLREISD